MEEGSSDHSYFLPRCRIAYLQKRLQANSCLLPFKAAEYSFFFLNCFSSVSYISHLQSVPSIPKFTLSSWLLNDYYFFFILAFDMRLLILGFPYMRTL